VPRISYFKGIAIYMYWNEGAHATPHFHAHHEGARASVGLDGHVLAGQIDPGALRLVQEWTRIHRDELLANWERSRRAEPILPIDPLA
jgi:hypothetical protein